MNRIGIIAESFGSLKSPTEVSSTILMKSCGYNLGNWAFWNATKKLINNEVTLISGKPKSEDYIDKIDTLVIPAANWLQPKNDFSWLADFIEGINKPCIMIGLGAQSHDEKKFHPLTEGTLRMLQAVSSRTSYIGVRGEYSYNTCLHHGIKNVEILGCPSLFTNNSPTLGQRIAENWKRQSDGKTIIHAAIFSPNVKHVEQWLFEKVILNASTAYIIQAPPSFIKPLFRENLHQSDLDFIEKYRDTFKEGINKEDLLKIIYNRSYLPYSVDSWINYISYFSRAIGTRIHGSMLSLTAGTPAICITHDSRTTELCNRMKVPSIPCDNISKEHTIDELFDQVGFDANSFDENRRLLAQQYKQLLNEVDIQASNHLKKIIN